MAIAASPNLDIESLRRALTGQVFTPEDAGYDDAHRLFALSTTASAPP